MNPCEVIFQLSTFPAIGTNNDFDSAPLGACLVLNASELYVRVNQSIPASPTDWVKLGNVTNVTTTLDGDDTIYDIIMADINYDVLYGTQLSAIECE